MSKIEAGSLAPYFMISSLGSWAMQGTPDTKLGQSNQWRGNGVCGQRLRFSVGQGLRHSNVEDRLESLELKRNKYDGWIDVPTRLQKRELLVKKKKQKRGS
jgi:hypothetical protein